MFIIISYELGCEESIYLVNKEDDTGGIAIFNTKEKAEQFAKNVCGFEYKIVEL